MLSFIEKIAFILLSVICLSTAFVTFNRMFKVINSGTHSLKWKLIFKNWKVGLWAFLSQKTLFKTRPIIGFVHAIVAWGFTLYLFVNVFDLLYGFIPGFKVFPNHFIGHLYRFFVDVFSILILFGIIYFISRRFLQKDRKLKIESPVMLSELAKSGIKFDSIFVGLFIFIHVGSRFLSASFEIAHSKPDIYQPAANAMAKLWISLPYDNIIFF